MNECPNKEMIATVALSRKIGFQCTVDFLESCGCVAACKTKLGVYWYLSDFNSICLAIVSHLHKKMEFSTDLNRKIIDTMGIETFKCGGISGREARIMVDEVINTVRKHDKLTLAGSDE